MAKKRRKPVKRVKQRVKQRVKRAKPKLPVDVHAAAITTTFFPIRKIWIEFGLMLADPGKCNANELARMAEKVAVDLNMLAKEMRGWFGHRWYSFAQGREWRLKRFKDNEEAVAAVQKDPNVRHLYGGADELIWFRNKPRWIE